jgi:hypothetical protein
MAIPHGTDPPHEVPSLHGGKDKEQVGECKPKHKVARLNQRLQ